MFAYFRRLAGRFGKENFAQLAGSLAFTTLLSIVPLIAISLTIASTFPVFAKVIGHVDNFLIDNLMPGRTGGMVAKYVAGFSSKAHKLTVIGIGMLVVTSLLLMFSIEKAFNHLWRVVKPRPLHQRAGIYLAMIAFGPIVAGALIGTMTYAVTTSLGFFNEPAWVRQTFYKGLALLVLCAFFSFLYVAVPNTKVLLRHAVTGGVVATAGIALVQRGFEAYVISFPTYTVVYGAFAILPLFLVWVYLCWVVVLIGALVAANFHSGAIKAPRPGR